MIKSVNVYVSNYKFQILVRLRNSYANVNNTIKLFSIQIQMSMHWAFVATIVIMAAYDKICHDDNSGDDLHLNRK